MVTARTGWALRASRFDRLQAVLRTTSGGRRWTAVMPRGVIGAGWVSLTARGARVAALVVRRPRDGVVVWRTMDAGRSWSHGGAVPSRFGGGVQFDGPRLGWLTLGEGVAAGSSGLRFLSTRDGGQTWREVMTSSGGAVASTHGALPFMCDKDGISFATPLRAFAGGFCAGAAPFFFVSNDGGRTWQHRALPGMRGTCECLVSAPVFFSARGGVLTARVSSQPATVYLTTDAGPTWYPLRMRSAGPVSFVDVRHGWVTHTATTISRTTDGGRHWTDYHTPFDASQTALDFVTRTAGFAIEGPPHADRLWATTDAGAHWRLIVARRAAR